MSLCFPKQKPGLLADSAKQAVAHFVHQCIRSAWVVLVLFGAQVNRRPARKLVCLFGDVAVVPAKASAGGLNFSQALGVGHRYGIGQQHFNLTA